ncbi:MAG: hypothetical protein ABL888_14255 [Pirellulaceae bacterium]
MNEHQKKSTTVRENAGVNSWTSRLLSPVGWSWAAIVCSVAYFVMMLYLLDTGLVSATDMDTGFSIHRVIAPLFLPISIAASLVCLIALVLNAWAHRWTWFAAVLFFSFFFASCFWAMIEESNRQRPPW